VLTSKDKVSTSGCSRFRFAPAQITSTFGFIRPKTASGACSSVQCGQRVRVPGYGQDLSTARIERFDNDAADAAAAAKNNNLLLRQ